MKHLLTILVLILITSSGKCQNEDHIFMVPPEFRAGFIMNGTLYTTMPTGGTGIVDWASITNKPTTFPPSTHNHSSLYKPISYVPTWAEITGKPAEVDLKDAIPMLDYISLPQKTTAEKNALVIPVGRVALVWDKTLGLLSIWNGTMWKNYPTLN